MPRRADLGSQLAPACVLRVAGTEDGITALQIDIKIQAITREIMHIALGQARDARLHILGEMAKVISAPRPEMSEWAPTIMSFKIDPERIREVIGKGGAVIRAIKFSDGLAEGDEVKVLEVDRQGRARLSMREVDAA